MGARSISDHRAIKRGAGAFALALLCVWVIAWLQRAGWLTSFNEGLMLAAGEARQTGWGGPVTTGLRLVTTIGDTIGRFALLAVALLWLAWRRRWRDAFWLIGLMAGGTLLNLGLKQIFAAPRPDLLQHLDVVTSYSFPSGHAAGNMILFGAVAILIGRRSARVAAALIIAAIGISRVWLGVHWPTDVLAGWIMGLGWLALWRAVLPAWRGQE